MTTLLELVADTPLSVKVTVFVMVGLAAFGFGLALGAALIRTGMAVRDTVYREPHRPAARIDGPDDWMPAPMYLPRDDARP